jgi:DNA-binding SARP family transcriptional activator
MASLNVDLRVLGPFMIRIDGRIVHPGQPKQRALLALLALNPGVPVPLSEIIDALWDRAPKAGARNQVQVYVSRLRRRITAVPIDTHPAGYILDVPAECVDLTRFERSLTRAGHLIRDGDLAAADRILCEALRTWIGRPLTGVPGTYFERLADQLLERRLSALEQHVNVRLGLVESAGGGDFVELTRTLRPAVTANPLHEGLRHGLMLALYHDGRPAEALAVYREGRRRIVDELGIEPGPRLRALELRILRGDRAEP